MGKTRNLFKKFRDTKGTFHAKLCTINDRNSMDITEAEDINEPGNHDGVITHLKADILECEVKCA